MFVVPIRNAKNVEEMKYHIDAPMIKYWQSTLNSCYFSSFSSAFDCINQIKAVNVISNCIEESLTSQVGFRNCIGFSDTVLKTQKRIKGEHKFYYKLKMFKHNVFKYIEQYN